MPNSMVVPVTVPVPVVPLSVVGVAALAGELPNPEPNPVEELAATLRLAEMLIPWAASSTASGTVCVTLPVST